MPTALPVTGRLRRRDDVLCTGDVPLDEWFTTRWWEVDRLNAAMVTWLAAWPWTGPVYPVVLVPEDRRAGVPGWRSQPAAGSVYPLVYANIAIRALSQGVAVDGVRLLGADHQHVPRIGVVDDDPASGAYARPLAGAGNAGETAASRSRHRYRQHSSVHHHRRAGQPVAAGLQLGPGVGHHRAGQGREPGRRAGGAGRPLPPLLGVGGGPPVPHPVKASGRQTGFTDYPEEKIAFHLRTPTWRRARAAHETGARNLTRPPTRPPASLIARRRFRRRILYRSCSDPEYPGRLAAGVWAATAGVAGVAGT